MKEDTNLVTREQYIEMLIEASFWDTSEMGSGFMSWCERHVPTWRHQGYDETWIRQHIETAQSTRGLHRKLKEQGCTMLEIREELRKLYADHPELYELARERERLQPGLLRYRGNTGDLRQRYTLRVMIYETDKLTFEKFCRWNGLPVPGSESIFFEQPDHVRVVRDLSTVEELELMLAMSRYALHLFDAPENLTTDRIASLMEAHGKELRAIFIARHGYPPEDSTTPYVPVTIDAPRIMRPIMLENIRNRKREMMTHQEDINKGCARKGPRQCVSLSSDQPALIVVTGIMASGKSTVGRLLAQRFAQGVHIEADVLQRMIVSGGIWVSQPGETDGEAARQLRLRLKNLCLLGRSFFEAGFTVVLDDIIMGDRWQLLQEELSDLPFSIANSCAICSLGLMKMTDFFRSSDEISLYFGETREFPH